MIESVLKFISNYFNLTVLALFLISSALLIFGDCAEYKKYKFEKECKFTKAIGYCYIFGGLAIYIAATFIRI